MRTLLLISAAACVAACEPIDNCKSTAGAELAAEDYVSGLMRDPHKTKFHNVRAASIGDCKFKVTGTVEAQNGFGAWLEKPFSLVAEPGGGHYRISEIAIGDELGIGRP